MMKFLRLLCKAQPNPRLTGRHLAPTRRLQRSACPKLPVTVGLITVAQITVAQITVAICVALLAAGKPAVAQPASKIDGRGAVHGLCAKATDRPGWAGICASYTVKNGRFAELLNTRTSGLPEALLSDADILIIGEVHDNPSHHTLQAELLAAYVRSRQKRTRGLPELVMEHIQAGQQSALDAALKARRIPGHAGIQEVAARLATVLSWKNSGWPDWAMFQPIMETALQLGLPIRAGNASKGDVRQAARQGLSAIPSNLRTAYHLNEPLPGPLADALLGELEASHCNLMPRRMFTTMAVAQRLRDATLASNTVAAVRRSAGAVLLTGNGHARTDRGVPWYITRTAPELRVLSVALIEVVPGEDDATKYLPRGPGGRPAADIVVITKRAERADPCVGMREKFTRKR